MKPTLILPLLALTAGLLPAGATEANRKQDTSLPVEDQIVRLDVDARADYQYTDRDGHADDSESGFRGKYLTLRMDGRILPGLTYSWRQRFNKNMADFNATDWLYLNFETGRWNFQGGKTVIAIGGYEYDRAPQDLYQNSVFWNNTGCYAFGASAGYNVTTADRLTGQVTESPFAVPGMRNIYAYNLMWTGRHGIYESIWSANMMEYAKGRYINYLALGNKFTVDKWWLELDFMNRAAHHQTFLFKDCSVMAELSFSPDSRWRIFGKYTYDVNHARNGADYVVAEGTELNMAGAGLEYFPLKKSNYRLRIHAAAFYSWGKNGNTANTMQDKTTFLTCGLTWDMNVLNIRK